MISAIIGVILGLIFIGAVLAGQVGLSLYVLILGIYMVGGSILMLLYPAHTRDVFNALFLQQNPLGQSAMLWMTGLMRIVIGVGLLYAAVYVAPAQEDRARGLMPA